MIFETNWKKVIFEDILKLYSSVSWEHYVKNPDKLKKAFDKSSCVIVAVDDDAVIGLIRVVTDEEYVCYIQDIIVHPHYQRHGVGRQLMEMVQDKYKVRTHILLTDDEERQRLFYESLGYKDTKEFDNGRLNAFVRFETHL